MIPKSNEKITASNFGAWLIKCDPKVWNLSRAMKDGLPGIGGWSVADNYRSESMEAGDDIVFGSVAPREKNFVRGYGESGN